MTSLPRRLGATFLGVSLGGSLLLTLACQPELPDFRGTREMLTLAPGESVHFTFVATRAAIDQATNGLVFRAETVPYGSAPPITATPDDPSLDELFSGAYGSVSAAELARICPATGECLIGLTLTQDEAAAPTTYEIRFGLETYDGFDAAAQAAAELD